MSKKAKSKAKGKRTKAVTRKGKAPTTSATKKPKPAKPTPGAKESDTKRVSALDAAAQVLAKADKPMRAKELIAAMAEQGLWNSPKGKTPHATLFSALHREIATKGKESRFKKVDRGAFASNG